MMKDLWYGEIECEKCGATVEVRLRFFSRVGWDGGQVYRDEVQYRIPEGWGNVEQGAGVIFWCDACLLEREIAYLDGKRERLQSQVNKLREHD